MLEDAARRRSMDSSTLAFIGVAIVIIVVPGPDMALVARNTLRHGRRGGLVTIAGISVGLGAWALAAGVGLAALLASSATAFDVVRLAGAAYLIALGLLTIRGPRHAAAGAVGAGGVPAGVVRAGVPPADDRRIEGRTLSGQGFLSAALNPKLGVFFVTLLPAFAPASDTLRPVQLALIFVVLGLTWLVIFMELLVRVGSLFRGTAAGRVL